MQKNKAICFLLAGMLSIIPFKEIEVETNNLFQAEQSIEYIKIDRFHEIKEIEKLAEETRSKREEEERLRKVREEQKKLEEQLEIESKKQYWRFEASYYCGCYYCTQNGNLITASGEQAIEGITIALPHDIPFGSEVHINNVGDFIVQDRGGYIEYTYDYEGNLIMRVDVFMENHNRALQLGRHIESGYIIINDN